MGKTLGDVDIAARVRDALRGIAEKEVDRLRPDIRIGKVFSADRASQTALILFPGNDETNLVPVRFALDKIPSSVMETNFEADGLTASSDVVRVAGRPGAYFILDYVMGAPLSEAVDLAKLEVNLAWAEETIPVPADSTVFYHDLQHTPLEFSETLHWNQLFQPRTEWKRQLRTLQILDNDNVLEAGDVMTYRYVYEVTDFKEVITYDSMPIVAAASWEDYSTGPLSLPQGAGVLPGDLIIFVGTAGSQLTTTDPRLKAVSGGVFPAYYGYATESTAPYVFQNSSSLSNHNSSLCCVIYRGLVVESVTVNGPNGSNPTQNHSYHSQFAVVGAQAYNAGVVAGTSISGSAPEHVARAYADDYKASCAIFDWFSKAEAE